MKTKKTNENKKMNKEELLDRLRAGADADTKLEQTRVPQATLRELVATGRAVVKRAPEPLAGGMETVALSQVTEACDLGDEVIAHNATLDTPAVRKVREEVVVRATSIKTALALWADSGTAPVAEAAARVQRMLFPADENLHYLPQHTLWQVVGMKQVLLDEQPELRATLEEVVPRSLTEALFTANDALGAAMGRVTGEVTEPIDQRLGARNVRQRLERYVAAVIATADPADAESVHRATRALQPIGELRAELRAAPTASAARGEGARGQEGGGGARGYAGADDTGGARARHRLSRDAYETVNA